MAGHPRLHRQIKDVDARNEPRMTISNFIQRPARVTMQRHSAAWLSIPAYSLSVSACSAGITSRAKRRRFLLGEIGRERREMEIGEKILEAQPAMRLDQLVTYVSGLPQRKSRHRSDCRSSWCRRPKAGRLIERIALSEFCDR